MLVLWWLDDNPIKPTFLLPPPIMFIDHWQNKAYMANRLFVHQHNGDSAGCLCTDNKSLLDVGGL